MEIQSNMEVQSHVMEVQVMLNESNMKRLPMWSLEKLLVAKALLNLKYPIDFSIVNKKDRRVNYDNIKNQRE